MNEQTRVSHPIYSLLPTEVEGFGPPADDLWTEACGKDRWLGTTETLEQDIRRVSVAGLWQFRLAASKSLVEYARERLSRQLAASGASAAKRASPRVN